MATKSRLLNRTHFEKRHGEKSDKWQWYWRTEGLNNEPIAVGGEGYTRLTGAINGFFSGQGCPDWEPDQPAMPSGYAMEKFNDAHYVITRYGEE